MSGVLQESVAFDAPTVSTDEYGGQISGWTEQFRDRVQFIYQRGREAENAGRLTGSAVFKVKMRSSTKSREITPDYRMRDVRRGVAFNIREVDAISDRRWVWLMAESGVAI